VRQRQTAALRRRSRLIVRSDNPCLSRFGDHSFLDFYDPWDPASRSSATTNVQFSKAPNVFRGMGLTHLSKSGRAIKELAEMGIATD